MPNTRYDAIILATIRGRTADDPQTLSGILGGVDARERLVLTHKELAGALERLIAAGQVVEVDRHRFCEAPPDAESATFSGLSKAEHDAAVDDYRAWFQRELKQLESEPDDPGPDDFAWRKLAVRWATPGRWPTDDDEVAAERLAAAIEPILGSSGLGEIIGFELGEGLIDIQIFGKAADADVNRIYELVAPPFRAFASPPGSRLVRFYEQRNEVIESDVVPNHPI